MRRSRPGSRSVALLIAIAAAGGGCGAGGDQPGMTIFPDMMESVPYDAYDPNPVLPEGSTLSLPPPGSVPVAAESFLYGTGEQEALRAGRELTNPFEASSENLARGQRVFSVICEVCHGPGGEGDGPVIGRFPNPPSLLSEHTRAYPDGRIYHVITRGQGIMPPHAVQVLPEDRWRLVLYIRQLQEEALEAAEPASSGAGPGDVQ